MRLIIASLLAVTTSAALTQESASPLTNAEYARLTTQAAHDEAALMTSRFVFERLQQMDDWSQAKAKLLNHWPEDGNSLKSYGYQKVLEERKNQGDLSGIFFWAAYTWNECKEFETLGTGNSRARQCWTDVLVAYKSISSRSPGASFNIAQMYQNGFGVTQSKYAAADWYVKAAKQSLEAGSRDDALADMEAALNLVPDHPAALRLRKTLLQ